MDLKNYKRIVELQHQFNLDVFPDYLDKKLNWNNAIIAESGELLDSLGYKWWKKQVPDMDNVKVETIDLLHFVVSEQIDLAYNSKNSIGSSIDIVATTMEDFFEEEDTYEEFNFDCSLNNLVDMLNYDQYDRFFILKQMFKKLEMNNEDVYLAYIVKNCLNQFRQNNGYKDGSYIKNWNDKEDNVVAYALANIIGAKENLFDELHESLNLYYNKEVLKVTKVSVVDTLDYFGCNKIN